MESNVSVAESRSDLLVALKHSQANALLTEQTASLPPLKKALRISRIRQAIQEKTYETPERLDAATEALMQRLIELPTQADGTWWD